MSFLFEPGDLSAMPLAAILLEALSLRASGALQVLHGGGTSRLWFRDGRPVGAQVVTGFRPLGLALVQAGLIDVEALSRSLARMAETKRPQGEILVEMGVVSPDDVRLALAEQQAEYFRIIASLETGRFAFDSTAVVPEWTRGSHLSPVRTIVDALERPQARALVASALAPCGAGVRLSSSYAETADAFRWTDAEGALVARLASPAPLDALLANADVGAERARAIVAALVLLGLAVSVAESPRPTGNTAILGPEAKAEADAPVAAAPQREAAPAESRARRQRLLRQAMLNMGVGPFAARTAATPPPTAQGAAPPGAPAAPAPPRADGPEAELRAAPPREDGPEAELRAALLAVAPRARERDLFARLGLTDAAGRDDAKRAFFQLARQFHPDRFASPALADLQEVVKDFFAAVNEAYEVLSDDGKRKEYLDRRKGEGRAHVESARVDFQKAEACLRTRDFARARGFLEAAVRADPCPEYQAALAFACIADPRHKDLDRARALLAEATKDASCDRAHYVAGLLARDEGDAGAAERSFRAAVKANPRHVDAVRELRLMEARRAEKRR